MTILKDTHDRLADMADGMPVATFLTAFATGSLVIDKVKGYEQSSRTTSNEQVEARLDRMESYLNWIVRELKSNADKDISQDK
jgi:hypothetical protein